MSHFFKHPHSLWKPAHSHRNGKGFKIIHCDTSLQMMATISETITTLPLMNSGVCLQITMFTRDKRNSPWLPSPLRLEHMGKSRKCTVIAGETQFPVKFHVSSTDTESIYLSSYQDAFVNHDHKFGYIESFELQTPCEFSFLISPVEKSRGKTKIILYISNPNVDSDPKTIMEWDISSMGHKFETSKKGKLSSLSKSSQSCQLLVFFNDTVFPRHIEDFSIYDVPNTLSGDLNLEHQHIITK